MSNADESRLWDQAETIFSWSTKRNVRSHLILKLSQSLLRLLFPSGVCSWSDGTARVANFPKELPLQDALWYHHTGNITSFGWRPPCGGAAGGGSFICLQSFPFLIILKIPQFIPPHNLFASRTVSLCFHWEPHVEIRSRTFPSPTQLNFCGAQTSTWLM